VAAVAHQRHHRQRHVERHREHGEFGVLVPRGVEAGPEQRNVDRPERHAENAHADHHRDGHLDHVPREPLELRPSVAS
jgi:hypothetical protein